MQSGNTCVLRGHTFKLGQVRRLRRGQHQVVCRRAQRCAHDNVLHKALRVGRDDVIAVLVNQHLVPAVWQWLQG